MFKIRKNTLLATMIGALVLLYPVGIQGAGTSTIHIDREQPAVGDSVTVDVVASEADSFTVKYNADVLTFSSCSAEYTTQGNAISFQGQEASISFTAKSEGKSSIIVSGNTVTGSSASIQVGAGSQEASQGQQQTTVTEGQFQVDGVAYIVSERFSEEEIPAGFERTRVSIDGYAYKALQNGTLTLVYLKPASDTSGSGVFYVYNEQENSVHSFQVLEGTGGYLLLEEPESLWMDGLEKVQISVKERTLDVYALAGQQEFVFAYGKNQDGEVGWYQYDTKEGTLQRVNQDLKVTAQEDDAEVQTGTKDAYYTKWSQQRYLLAILLFVIVILAVICVNLFIFRKRVREDDMWEDEMEEDDLNQQDVPVNENVGEEVSDIEKIEIEEPVAEAQEVEDSVAKELEVEEQNTQTTAAEVAEEKIVYKNMKGTEAFKSSKETRYKTNADDQIDILDLNDL